jgi:hypothetical protein
MTPTTGTFETRSTAADHPSRRQSTVTGMTPQPSDIRDIRSRVQQEDDDVQQS